MTLRAPSAFRLFRSTFLAKDPGGLPLRSNAMGPVLEELTRRLGRQNVVLVTQIRNRRAIDQVPLDDGHLLLRRLVDGVPISDLCDEHHILPTQFYQWQNVVLVTQIRNRHAGSNQPLDDGHLLCAA